MPNVLLIGGSRGLYEALQANARWAVTRVTRGESSSRDTLGDPRRWQLIIDEGEHWDGAHDGEVGVVSEDYIGEAIRGHIIRFVPRNGFAGVFTMTTPGNYDLQFNQTQEPAAPHLLDFVHEFEGSFLRLHLLIEDYRLLDGFEHGHFGRDRSPNPYRVLFKDYYGNPLIALGNFTPPVLYLVELPDNQVRLKAIHHLCTRTVPKLWPEVFSDQFRSSRVVEIEQNQEALVRDFRQEAESLERQKQEELDFYAKFAPLTELDGDPLKALVKSALETAFGYEVIDLDEEVGEDPKDLDLLIKVGDEQAFAEVRSHGTRGASKRDLEDLDDHVPTVTNRHGPPDGKLFVFNGLYRRSPEERALKKLFSADVIAEAEQRGITLISTLQLLETIEAYRNGDFSQEQMNSALKRPGVFKQI